MKAIKDNATYLEKIVTQDDGDTDFAKVTDTTVNYIPNEIPLFNTTTNTQLESEEELVENEEILLIDTDNNIIETQLGSVTTETIDKTQTLDLFEDNSCIACYPLDGNANDLSGNHNGVWGGTEQYNTGKYGQAAKFDGNSYINLGNLGETLGNNFTISLWYYVESDINSEVALLTQNNSGQSGFSIRSYGSNGIHCVVFKDGNATILGTSNVTGKWNNVILWYNGTTLKMWYNNSLIGSKEGGYALANYNTNVGRQEEGNRFYFNGLIDQVRIFNRALTEDEIQQLYNEQKTKYTADISSANLSEAPVKTFKKQLPSVSIAVEATETDITDTRFNELTPKTTTYDGSKFTTVYSDLVKEGRFVQRKIVAPNKGIQVIEPFTSNLWKKDS